ncbi:MAG: TolC family protein [Leptospiraceae bacterium]|nr:TolC family protein [Leptospiraceae bacterium]
MRFIFRITLFILFTNVIYPEKTDSHADNSHCAGNTKLLTIVECVLDHSPEFKKTRLELIAIKGKKIAASYLFPSNPTISVVNAYRKQSQSDVTIFNPVPQTAFNGELQASQEFYLGGQRGKRMEVAESEFSAQIKRVSIMERNTTAEALSAAVFYRNSLEEFKITEFLYQNSLDMAKVVQARAEKGLAAEIDADIANAEVSKTSRLLNSSIRKRDGAKGNLTVMMGVNFNLPLSIIDTIPDIKLNTTNTEELVATALKQRTEIEEGTLNIRIAQKRIELLKREAIPNLTVSAYVQRDGFNENVVGGRASIPLRVWRDNSGEILESQAKKDQSITNLEVNQHTIHFEVIKAVTNYNSLRAEFNNYPQELLKKVDANLLSLKKALSAGQINIRDALVAQNSLVGLKLSYIQSQSDYDLSKIELIRSIGFPLLQYAVVTK